MYAGYLKDLPNRVAARAFHIQSQECGNRRRYVYVGNLREPDALFMAAPDAMKIAWVQPGDMGNRMHPSNQELQPQRAAEA